MLLFLVSRDFKNVGYDQYISFICASPTATQAKAMKPWDVSASFDRKEVLANYAPEDKEWVKPCEHFTVQCVGEASAEIKQGVIHASYHHA